MSAVLRELSPARIFARPTAEELWLGPAQESALSHLIEPIPVRALLGPASSGRSSLLAAVCGRTAASSLRSDGRQRTARNLLDDLIRSAGLDGAGLGTSETRRLLTVYILERLARGQRVVIELDDADTIAASAWQEIVKLTASAEHGDRRPELLLSLVHLDPGGSAAGDFLRECAAPALCVLSWLTPEEVHAYLHWRLERFDLVGAFTPSAVRLIARCTEGRFAAVDHISQIALLLLRNGAGEQVDVTLVREAMRVMRRKRRAPAGRPLGRGRAEVIVSCDGQTLGRHQLNDRTLIGRSPLNDICLDGSFLSRHHAVILRNGETYQVSDLNSVNGLRLNGAPATHSRLAHGDVLQIGPYRLKFEYPEEMRSAQSDTGAQRLADTAVMPTPEKPEPAHLKVIK